MDLRDPVAAYTAVSNTEAHLICDLLRNAGIPAAAMEDVSGVGLWLGGTLAGIHKPQVWVERADLDRARPVLTEYERQATERRAAERGEREAMPPVVVVCEECGKESQFPAAQQGTVQSCPHCHAYVDVGDDVGLEGWDEVPGEDEAEPAADDE
jgi:hypothetical protein